MRNCYAYDSSGQRCALDSPDIVWASANYARRLLGTEEIPSSITRVRTRNGTHFLFLHQAILDYMAAEEKTRGVCCYAHCRKKQCKDTKYGLCEIHEQNSRNVLRKRVS